MRKQIVRYNFISALNVGAGLKIVVEYYNVLDEDSQEIEM